MRPLLTSSPSCHRRRRGLRRRESYPERAAHADLRAHADLAAHHVHHPLRDRETEAEPRLLEGTGPAVEALEDAVDLLGRDTGARVAHLDHDLAVVSASSPEGNFPRR